MAPLNTPLGIIEIFDAIDQHKLKPVHDPCDHVPAAELFCLLKSAPVDMVAVQVMERLAKFTMNEADLDKAMDKNFWPEEISCREWLARIPWKSNENAEGQDTENNEDDES